ncbi:DUF1572 family protein [Myroides marinus]|uniref:DUF1572 domain-containing protein n=1 Tax=Myroides marinus TaxID=703342 RepID=A0A1H6V7S6_9FLAO|nr:DUF1572 family protein [Myroides marinus]MDM1348302.1 DUF1572 family protein [Myroides marinus]MDM1351790.1 DUF1572 family protein [Myroides marinus]MDM1355380.1 DUF1572 family protein [Myroides marinus]MDM1359022.1 DUF1572 family protein [Myroides marinus]MDM1366076.1 DUF1572 family protein [Myroides marinus]
MNIEDIKGVRTQFEYYRTLADKTILIFSQDELNHKVSDGSNSIAMIMRHITGNLLSRFTNFFTEDGDKPWRNRDDEFQDGIYDKHELITNWDKAWNVLFQTLDSITEENINTVVKIRNQNHTVAEALYRQLAHYPYHIGQIVFIGKMIRNTEWQSLSIPKNMSKEYNKEVYNYTK